MCVGGVSDSEGSTARNRSELEAPLPLCGGRSLRKTWNRLDDDFWVCVDSIVFDIDAMELLILPNKKMVELVGWKRM